MLTLEAEILTIDELAKGNIEAFDKLYQNYHQVVFANISKFVQQADVAEDVLQEVFLSLWENRKKIDANQNVGGWLLVVSYNKCMAVLKKRIKENTILLENISDLVIEDDIQTCDIQELHLNLLNDAVNLLSPRKKKAFQLCRLEGKSYLEAALVLGVSPGTIKDYIKDSLKFIREFVLSKYSGTSVISILLLSHYLQP